MTPKERALLERLSRRPLLATQLASNDGRAVDRLMADQLARWDDHPTVIDRRTNGPALALFITDAGRAACAPGALSGKEWKRA